MSTQIFIAIDIETTGLDVGVHQICQLGALAFTKLNLVDKFEMDVGHEPTLKSCDSKALQVNGFTLQRIRDGVPQTAALDAFTGFIDAFRGDPAFEVVFVFHNAAFDIGFIKYALHEHYPNYDRHGLFRRPLDTLSLGFRKFSTMKSLGDLHRTLFSEEMINKHDALFDADATRRVALELLKDTK